MLRLSCPLRFRAVGQSRGRVRRLYSSFLAALIADMGPDEQSPPLHLDRNRIVVLCGLPTRLIGHVVVLLQRILAARFGSCDIININELSQDILDRIETSSGGSCLLWADSPDSRAVAFARDLPTPPILLESDFEETVLEFMRTRGAALLDTLRVMAKAQMGFWQLSENSSTVKIGARGQSVVAIVQQIGSNLRHLIGAPDDVVMGIVDAGVELDIPVGEQGESTYSDTDAITRFADFYGQPCAQDARTFDVPVCAFYSGIPPHDPFSGGAVELLGPQRVLTFGPFIYLPAGRWNLAFHFRASGNVPSNTFMFDVFADMEVKARLDCTIDRNGEFRYDCEFEVRNPWETVEFRSHLARGSISGQFMPLSVTLKRV